MLKTTKVLLIMFFFLSLSLASEQKEINLSDESSAFDTEISLLGKIKTSGARALRSTIVDTLLSEGFENSVPPSQWDTINLSGNHFWTQATVYAHTGSYAAKVSLNGINEDVWLVTDTLDLSTVSACSLSFYQYGDWMSLLYNYFGIWVSTSSPTDTSTFTEVTEVDTTGMEDAWQQMTVDLSDYGGNSTVFVAFRINDDDACPGWWIDDVVIHTINSSPGTPTLIKKFDNAIYNAWYDGVLLYTCSLSVSSTDPQGDDINYQILYGTDPELTGASPWDIGPFSSGDTATTAIFLGGAATAETLYYWKARATDPSGTDDWSNWSVTRSFIMDMNLGTDPAYWYQTAGTQFENCTLDSLKVEGDSVVISDYLGVVDVGFESTLLPSGWDTLTRGASPNNWAQVTDKVYEGAYSAKISFDAKDTVDAWLVTNALDLSPFSSCTLLFWGCDTFADDYQYHGIWASTTSQTDTSTFSVADTIDATAEGTWTKSTVDLSTYAGNSTVYVAFRYKEINGSIWWVDNVFIKGVYITPPTGGYITSPPIVFSDLQNEDASRDNWLGAKWTKSSADDSIGLQIQYLSGGNWNPVPDGDLPGNSAFIFQMDTFFCNISDVSNLSTTTYDTLRLKAKFIADTTTALMRSAASPSLIMWALGGIGGITAIPLSDDELKFALYLPNPNLLRSGNETEIKYQIPGEVEVKLGVFDLLGREVKSIVNAKQSRGTYSVKWSGTNNYDTRLACGIYFLSLEAGEFRDVKKLVFLP